MKSIEVFYLRLGIALATLLMLVSCAQLNQVLTATTQLQPPSVALKDVALAETPTQKSLTAYVCPKVLDDRFHMGMAGELACSQFFGRVPDTQALKIGFDIRLSVANPNRVPLPLSSVLLAINVFPGAQQSALGAACVSLCSPNDPQCGGRDANACPSGATDVTKRAEIAQSLGKIVIAEGARLASGEALGVKAPQVLASSTLDVVVHVSLDPQQLLPILQQLANQSGDQLREGKPLSLSIPYSMSGTLFTGPMGSVGVLSAPFGPTSGTWQAK